MKFEADGDLFNKEDNIEASASDNNNEVDQDYNFYNDIFNGQIIDGKIDKEIDNDIDNKIDEERGYEIDGYDKTSDTESYMEEMYLLYMKKT